MFVNRMPRYEPLSEEALATIDRGWERVAREIGVQFDHPRALELFGAAGQTVDGDTVRLRPGLPAGAGSARAQACSRCGRGTALATSSSAATTWCSGPRRARRSSGSTASDATARSPTSRTCCGSRSSPTRSTRPGRNILEPNDVPLDSRHLVRTLASIRLTDRVWAGEPSSETAAHDCLRMAEIVFGGREQIEQEPVIFANVNVNSPLRFDSRMLEGLITYAEAGQAVIVTPFLLMGAMAPVTPPAALVQQTAEVLAGIALAQLVRPEHALRDGVVPLDSRHEERLARLRRAGVGVRPLRVGTDRATARAAVALRRRDADLQPGGRLPGRLRGLQHAAVPRSSPARTCAGSRPAGSRAVWSPRSRSSPPTARSSTCCSTSSRRSRSTRRASPSTPIARSATAATSSVPQHTLERFRECFWRPTVASTENNDRWTKGGSLDHDARAARRWKELLATYERPPIDEAVETELIEFVERRARRAGRRRQCPLTG